MLLISGACFLCGAYNLAAFFAGNGYGVVAVALCGIGCFGFGADMVAGSGRNGNNNFFCSSFRNNGRFTFTACYFGSKLCFGFFCYIFFCSEHNRCNGFSFFYRAFHVHVGKANLKVSAVFIRKSIFSYGYIAIFRRRRLYGKQTRIKIKSCFKQYKITIRFINSYINSYIFASFYFSRRSRWCYIYCKCRNSGAAHHNNGKQ